MLYIHPVCAWSLGCRHIVWCFITVGSLAAKYIYLPFLAIVTTTLVFFRSRSVSSSSSSVPQTYKISPKILLFVRNYVLGITLLIGRLLTSQGSYLFCIVFSSLTHLEFQFPIWSKKSITRPSCKYFLQCHFFIACKQASKQALSPCCIVRRLS